MTVHEMKQRLKEIETLLEGCTFEEYRELAKEYSILTGRIEAEENLYSQRQKDADRRSAAARLLEQVHLPSYHALNQ